MQPPASQGSFLRHNSSRPSVIPPAGHEPFLTAAPFTEEEEEEEAGRLHSSGSSG
jgi:hypothetical protein